MSVNGNQKSYGERDERKLDLADCVYSVSCETVDASFNSSIKPKKLCSNEEYILKEKVEVGDNRKCPSFSARNAINTSWSKSPIITAGAELEKGHKEKEEAGIRDRPKEAEIKVGNSDKDDNEVIMKFEAALNSRLDDESDATSRALIDKEVAKTFGLDSMLGETTRLRSDAEEEVIQGGMSNGKYCFGDESRNWPLNTREKEQKQGKCAAVPCEFTCPPSKGATVAIAVDIDGEGTSVSDPSLNRILSKTVSGSFHCPKCSATFNSNLQLTLHVKKQHADKTINKALRLVQETQLGRIEVCGLCHRTFTDKNSFNDHFKKELTKIRVCYTTVTVEFDKKYICGICETKFSCGTVFNQHFLKFHTVDGKLYHSMLGRTRPSPTNRALFDSHRFVPDSNISQSAQKPLNPETIIQSVESIWSETTPTHLSKESSNLEKVLNVSPSTKRISRASSAEGGSFRNFTEKKSFQSSVQAPGTEITPLFEKSPLRRPSSAGSSQSPFPECKLDQTGTGLVARSALSETLEGANHVRESTSFAAGNPAQEEHQPLLGLKSIIGAFKYKPVHVSESELLCTACNMRFAFMFELGEHLFDVHSVGEHSCSLCGYKLFLKFMVYGHMLARHKQVLCGLCNSSSFWSGSGFVKHVHSRHSIYSSSLHWFCPESLINISVSQSKTPWTNVTRWRQKDKVDKCLEGEVDHVQAPVCKAWTDNLVTPLEVNDTSEGSAVSYLISRQTNRLTASTTARNKSEKHCETKIGDRKVPGASVLMVQKSANGITVENCDKKGLTTFVHEAQKTRQTFAKSPASFAETPVFGTLSSATNFGQNEKLDQRPSEDNLEVSTENCDKKLKLNAVVKLDRFAVNKYLKEQKMRNVQKLFTCEICSESFFCSLIYIENHRNSHSRPQSTSDSVESEIPVSASSVDSEDEIPRKKRKAMYKNSKTPRGSQLSLNKSEKTNEEVKKSTPLHSSRVAVECETLFMRKASKNICNELPAQKDILHEIEQFRGPADSKSSDPLGHTRTAHDRANSPVQHRTTENSYGKIEQAHGTEELSVTRVPMKCKDSESLEGLLGGSHQPSVRKTKNGNCNAGAPIESQMANNLTGQVEQINCSKESSVIGASTTKRSSSTINTPKDSDSSLIRDIAYKSHEPLESQNSQAELFFCPFCGKEAKTEELLQIHLTAHMNKKYTCVTCKFETRDKKSYKKHLRGHNENK